MLHTTGGSFIGMHFIWWFFWFAFIGIAFTSFTPIPRSQLRSGERALDILRRRYAAGQVSTEDYERRRITLERDEPNTDSTRPTHQH